MWTVTGHDYPGYENLRIGIRMLVPVLSYMKAEMQTQISSFRI